MLRVVDVLGSLLLITFLGDYSVCQDKQVECQIVSSVHLRSRRMELERCPESAALWGALEIWNLSVSVLQRGWVTDWNRTDCSYSIGYCEEEGRGPVVQRLGRRKQRVCVVLSLSVMRAFVAAPASPRRCSPSLHCPLPHLHNTQFLVLSGGSKVTRGQSSTEPVWHRIKPFMAEHTP